MIMTGTRTGMIAEKLGMSSLFNESGRLYPVTLLKIDNCQIIGHRTVEKNGYNAVVLGIGGKEWNSRKGKKNMRYSVQKEFRVESLDGFEPGKMIAAEILPAESMVTVEATSKGKGFQGVMRRHGFHGGPASHGSHFKREPGSIGMRTDPGRIFKGHKMAGHMGFENMTIKHRPVVVSDAGKNIIAIKGPVPGPQGAHVFLTLES